MLTGHDVQFVHDQDMPDGIDWLMIEADDAVICAVRDSKRDCPRVLEDAWAGFRHLADCGVLVERE